MLGGFFQAKLVLLLSIITTIRQALKRVVRHTNYNLFHILPIRSAVKTIGIYFEGFKIPLNIRLVFLWLNEMKNKIIYNNKKILKIYS